MPYQVFNPAIAAAAPVTTQGAALTSVGETLATFLDELTAELAGRADAASAALTDTLRKTRWLNWGYRHVCSIIDLKELNGSVAISIVDDQNFYLLPVQVAVARRLSIIDTSNYAEGGSELEKIDENLYRQLYDSATISGVYDEPGKWFRWRRMLVVWPTPSTARTCALDFKIRPDRLVNTTDSPLLPEEYHEAIFLAGLSRALRGLRMKAESKDVYNEMLTMLRPIINTDAEETPQMRNRVYQPAVLRQNYSGRAGLRRQQRWGGI